MQVRAIPIFENIHILRKSMLESLTDYAFLGNQLLYKGYGDGILSGCELTTTRDTIVLSEGVILYKGQFFLLKEIMSITYHPTNRTTVLKIHFSEEVQDGSFKYREVGLLLTEQTEQKKGELELCRFKLQEGARLRYEYQNFEDRDTEFDTLNTIYAPYAAKGGSSLSPDILREFSCEMLKEERLTPVDRCVCLQLLSQDRPVSREMLSAYIWVRRGKDMFNTSNHSLYRELVKILKEVREGKGSQSQETERKKWRMTVE